MSIRIVTQLDELFDRFRQGDRRALAQLLTRASRGEDAARIRREIVVPSDRGRVVALTGSAGVGKSTLIGKLVEHQPRDLAALAVLACDPESSLSGGALLGDRVRMIARPNAEIPFIRSLAAASGHQAVAQHIDLMLDLLLAFRFDCVLLETVGAGQGDTAVRQLADVLVLLVQPGTGDELQWEKAGLLEVADVVVVHKADLPTADRLVAELQGQLAAPGRAPVPVLKVSSATGTGLEELWNAILAQPARISGDSDDARRLLEIVQDYLSERLNQDPDRIRPIVERWRRREIDDPAAARELLRALGDL